MTPAQGAGTGLTASYFSNGTLAGAPVLKRLDPAIDFRWGKGAPAPGVPADNFSVRWEGLLAASSTGRYRFVAVTADEVRLWVNGKLVLDTWDHKPANSLADAAVNLAAGEKTSIKVEYNDADGDAGLQLQWVPPGQMPQTIPTSNLYPLGSPTTPDPAGRTVAASPPAPQPQQPVPAPAPAPEPKPAPKRAAKPVAQTEPAVPAAPVPAAETEKPTAAPAAPAAPAVALTPGGVYTLRVKSTNKPLEIEVGRPLTRSEQLAVQATGRSSAPQWRIETAGQGFYRLVVQGSNKVLEVLGSSTSNGAPLSLWNFYSGNNQLWSIEDAGGGYYKLIAKHSKKALTVKDSVDGGIQQWRFKEGRDNQLWKLEAVAAEEAPALMAGAGATPGVGANKMSVYPNPSNGVVQMAYELTEERPLGWVLYNERGTAMRVSDYRRQPAGRHHQTLDFTSLPAGNYYLSLTVGAVNTKQLISIRRPSAEAPTATDPTTGAPSVGTVRP